MRPLLEIQDLSRDFPVGAFARSGVIRAVDRVNLQLYPGEVLGLVGESGCGKSTLARCACKLIEPTSGSIVFDGIDLGSLSSRSLRQKRREFQMIFQHPLASLDPRMTVEAILSEPYELQGLGTRRERKEWISELMDAVALDGSLAGRLPRSLSGGQQQRIVIARALALKPRLLVADEPVSALDASVQAQILNLLSELQKRYDLTILLISHSLPVIHYLSSRVAVMYLGRIVEDAPADLFFTAPRHPYSQALVQSMPALNHSLQATRPVLAGEIPSAADPPPGCRFHPRCPSVMPRCREEYPSLSACAENAKVACFLYTQETFE
jgi:peptide/nickel transport system ATP-binding protein